MCVSLCGGGWVVKDLGGCMLKSWLVCFGLLEFISLELCNIWCVGCLGSVMVG